LYSGYLYFAEKNKRRKKWSLKNRLVVEKNIFPLN
jgi:hypothetical protein